MIACQPLADHLRLFPYWTPPTVPMPVLIYGQHEEDWRCLAGVLIFKRREISSSFSRRLRAI
jgi:hypothetical protein